MTVSTIYLHGRMRKQFGGPFKLAVSSPAEAVRALACQIPGFGQALREGYYRVIRGTRKRGQHLDASQLEIGLGDNPLHIIPAAAGAKDNGGWGKIIAGVAIAAVSFGVGAIAAGGVAGALGTGVFTVAGSTVTFGNLAMIGVSVALAGAAQLLAPTPPGPGEGAKRPDERRSYLFNGPVNSSQQGEPIPVVYGRVTVGSIVVSSGIDTEQIPV